jgi:hypothetical protein
VSIDHAARKPKPVQPQYHAQNVFAVLIDEDEDERQRQLQLQLQPQAPPAFMQPATFSFASSAPTFTMPAPLHAADVDPDL